MFGFPEIAHQKFKQNFLRTVVFNFNYNTIPYDLKANSSKIHTLFKDILPAALEIKNIRNINLSIGNDKIETTTKHVENDVVLTLKNKTNNKILTITNQSINYNIAGSDYDSFIEIKKDLEKIKILLTKVFNVILLTSTNLRKINVVELNNNISGQLTYDIFNDIVKQGNLTNPNIDFVLNNITVLTMKNKENSQLILKYGINSPSNTLGLLNHILIDIDIQLLNKNSKEIVKNIESANNESFNIFSWVISDKFVNEVLNK